MNTRFSRILAAAVLSATGLSAPAGADLLFENESGGTVLLYGQFNPAYQSVDDGLTTTTTLVDSAHSNSRVGLWWRQPHAAGQLSFNFETALGLRPSNLVSQGFTPDALNWRRVFLRKTEFIWNSDSYGKVSVGQGSMASDGVAQSDLSGTGLVNYVAIGDSAGGFRFNTFTDVPGAPSGPTIGAAMPDFDGGRRARIRYDTPEFSGFSVAVAYGEEVLVQNSDLKSSNVALNYAREAGGFRMQGAIAYSRIEPSSGVVRRDTIGSFSVLHDSGFNVTLAAGNRDTSGAAVCGSGCDYVYGKVGYQAQWFAVGKTALAIDYYRSNDTTVAGSEGETMGIGVVQSFDRQNVQAYLGYHDYGLTEPGVVYRDIGSVLFGARWRF